MKVYQIEVSNLCNLECSYCPHVSQQRPKGLMNRSTFEEAIQLVLRCGQDQVWLHNFGEPLLHPDLAEFIAHASAEGVQCSFYTNGLLLTPEIADSLANAGLRQIRPSDRCRTGVRCQSAYTVVVSSLALKRLPRESSIS